MDEEFAETVAKALRAAIPDVPVYERIAAYRQGGPKAGQVTYNVGYADSGSPLARIISVSVDVDVWANGPDNSAAEDVARKVEAVLIDFDVNTEAQGNVVLRRFSRQYMTDQVEGLAHLTMRFTGRGFRRLIK